MILNELKTQDVVFIDANIFLYHFTGVSDGCKEFLKRCETKDLLGVTGLTVMVEVCHHLMIAEAIKQELISTAKPTVQLQKKPEVVKKLFEYSAQVMNIINWGIRIIIPPSDILIRSQVYRTQFGLLTNDSFIPVYMKLANTDKLATLDQAFISIPSLQIYSPFDVYY